MSTHTIPIHTVTTTTETPRHSLPHSLSRVIFTTKRSDKVKVGVYDAHAPHEFRSDDGFLYGRESVVAWAYEAEVHDLKLTLVHATEATETLDLPDEGREILFRHTLHRSPHIYIGHCIEGCFRTRDGSIVCLPREVSHWAYLSDIFPSSPVPLYPPELDDTTRRERALAKLTDEEQTLLGL